MNQIVFRFGNHKIIYKTETIKVRSEASDGKRAYSDAQVSFAI